MADTKIWLGNVSGYEGKWDYAANWSPSGVPAATDNVYLENSSQSVLSGLDQSAVALGSLNIAQSFIGSIGTATAYLQIGAALVNIGYHFGPGEAAGSPLLKLDLGTGAATIIVFDSGISADSTRPAIRLKYVNAATTLEVRKGEVGVAIETNEETTGASIDLGYVDNIESDAKVYIGSGVTLAALTKKGGFCMLQSAVTTIKNYAGELITEGSGAITSLYAIGGNVISNSTGTITNCYSNEKGFIDFTKSAQPRTVTNCTIDDEGAIKADSAVITFTNKIIFTKPTMLRASAA